MERDINENKLVNPHVSVDCVVIGFDGEQLKVLLVQQLQQIEQDSSDTYTDMKLPGSLIYEDEDLDEAAQRVLYELTGIKNVNLLQFRAFGSKNRTHNPKDVRWLERFHQLKSKIERIVTVAYISMVKIDKKLENLSDKYQARWMEVKDLKVLAFDHNQIISEAITYIRQFVEMNPSVLFDLLPRKFTASELRVLYELVYDKEFDVRNFHKKIAMMEYVVPLLERQTGVPHRAARYYKFDRKIFNKLHGTSKSFSK
ncbi:NUDIX domain-containing protein [uncultured Bacteroides sp.]|uniref:NUDIX hydrolase n=1 Tax=uncultured Bacteroides sp. TaxID=162156 RepID=UPI002AA8A850|nr:NUDIX domain-containing protein [uncultured Bacteroides sp.]